MKITNNKKQTHRALFTIGLFLCSITGFSQLINTNIGGKTGSKLVFKTNNTQRMIIDTGGNVKIGTGSINTAYQFEVTGAMHAATILTTPHINFYPSGTTNGIQIDGGNYTITSTNQTVGFSNDTVATTGGIKTPSILLAGTDSAIRFGYDGFRFITHKRFSCSPEEILTGSNGKLTILDSSGANNIRVGIGTITPNAALQIYSTMSTRCSISYLEFCITNTTTNKNVFTVDNGGNTFIPTGKMSIGVASTDMPGSYGLYVKGGILTQHCRVAKDSTTDWSDYVFSDTYKLPTIDSLENYINKNHHLQDIPSTEDVTKNGIDVAQMDAQLLKKIEELTLYVIQLQKDNTALKNDNVVMKKEIEAIKK